jgi:hypothetical protein
MHVLIHIRTATKPTKAEQNHKVIRSNQNDQNTTLDSLSHLGVGRVPVRMVLTGLEVVRFLYLSCKNSETSVVWCGVVG